MPSYPRDPNLHKNHRSRLRKKALDYGVDCLEDHELLEMLLFSSVPRVDTNETAHRAIEACGSLPEVLASSEEELLKLPRIGPGSVGLLKTVHALCTRYIDDYGDGGRTLRDTDSILSLCEDWFRDRSNKNLLVVSLDSLDRVLKTADLRVETETPRARLVAVTREAAQTYASAVVIAYAGDSHFAAPTNEDRALVKELSAVLNKSRVRLVECVIFAGERAFPMSRFF